VWLPLAPCAPRGRRGEAPEEPLSAGLMTRPLPPAPEDLHQPYPCLSATLTLPPNLCCPFYLSILHLSGLAPAMVTDHGPVHFSCLTMWDTSGNSHWTQLHQTHWIHLTGPHCLEGPVSSKGTEWPNGHLTLFFSTSSCPGGSELSYFCISCGCHEQTPQPVAFHQSFGPSQDWR
jgi:hypothetical protein